MSKPQKCPRCKTDKTDCPVAGMADKTYTPQEYCLADITCSLRAIVERLDKGYIDIRTVKDD